MASRANHTQPGKPWLPTTEVGSFIGNGTVISGPLSGRRRLR